MAVINGTENDDTLVGTTDPDTINGLGGNDVIAGLDGNDTLNGDAGDDTISGNNGNDTLNGGDGNDTLSGNNDNDTLNGDAGNDMLDGGTGVDALNGGDGDDVLTGADTSVAADTLAGGVGNDIYIADRNDIIIENADEGIDEIRINYDIYSIADKPNIENLTAVGFAGPRIFTGNALNNIIRTDSLSNSFDHIDGGAGADTMIGGTGDDVYTVDNLGDIVIELANQGFDTIIVNGASYILGADVSVEFLRVGLNSGVSITGNDLTNDLLHFSNEMFGGTGNDTLNGAGGLDILFGMAGNDILIGGTGNDILDLRDPAINPDWSGPITLASIAVGADTMTGGLGSDSYGVDNAGDVVVENPDEGYDSVATTLASYTLPANVERLTGILNTGQSLTGNELDNLISAGSGDDTLIGGDGADTLDGGGGSDILFGGPGNDTYLNVTSADTVLEQANEGIDTIVTALATYSLASLSNIENLTGTSVAGQTLTGNANANVIDGGGGGDTLIGGAGDDTYIVRSSSDVVTENAGQGIDTIVTALASFSLAALPNVENLTGTGPGGQTLTGNASANVIQGGAGNDIFDLSGGGNDHAIGGDGNDGFSFGAAFTAEDVVEGGAGTNDQIGLQGDYTGLNALTLGAGTMTGIEAIVVLPGFSYDLTMNDGNVATGGLLKVQATQLAAGQSLHFDGSAEHDGSFMTLGGQGDDSIIGGWGNDGFYFGPGGFNSADVVNGGPGTNDQLGLDGDYGSVGSPLVLGTNVTNVEVVVLMPGPSGTPNHFNITSGDAFVGAGQTMTIFGLQTSTGFTFDGSHEHDGAFRIYGGSGNDVITGGTGADWLFGGDGTDTLTGGAGNDVFYYDAVSQSTPSGRDGIQDFATGDTMDLSGIDAIAGGGDDAFSFIGSGAFTNHAGELRAVNTAGPIWTVSGDVNGDGVADFELTLVVSDAHPLAVGDFTL